MRPPAARAGRSLRRSCRLAVVSLALGAAIASAASRTPAVDPPFDHFMTRFPLTGAHARVPCETCHLRGVFAGTPQRCSACHGAASEFASTYKSGSHIPSSNVCEDCHATTNWSSVRFDHGGVFGSCASCHNGVAATGKSARHVTSSNACDDCHGTVAWIPADFDHAGVIGSCSRCHNGVEATGKSSSHIVTTASCETCHSTSSWRTAGTFDHAAVTGDCATCHNGVAATGKSSTHIATTGSCDTCHGTSSWVPASFDHDAITSSCNSCHNGVAATGKDAGHFVTATDCSFCHRTTAWLPLTFDHASPNYPGDHAGNPVCLECHESNSQIATWTFPTYTPDCAGCHASDYRPGAHKKVESPEIYYTVAELRDCEGACHIYTDTTLSTIQRSRSGEHHVGSREL